MSKQEADLPSVLVSPEMTDVLQELAHEKGMDLDEVLHQHRLIMGHLSIESSKD